MSALKGRVILITGAGAGIGLGDNLEAGDAGGNLVYEGVPEGLKKVKESYTGKYL